MQISRDLLVNYRWTTGELPVNYWWITGELPVNYWWTTGVENYEQIPQFFANYMQMTRELPVNYWWTTGELPVNYRWTTGELPVNYCELPVNCWRGELWANSTNFFANYMQMTCEPLVN